jgi:hypothetical protein
MNSLAKYFLLIVVLSAFFSCKKSNTGPNSRTLNSTGLMQQSAIRLFTDGREITDQSVIKKFVANDSLFTSLTFKKYLYSNVKFFTADSIIFDDNKYAKYHVFNKTGSTYVFYSATPITVTPIAGRPVFTKYNAPVSNIPAYAGGQQLQAAVAIGLGTTTAMQFPVLVYQIKYATYYNEQGFAYNQFDENTKIAANDTLAVQQFGQNFN